jgi:hypothetical protein
MNKFIAAAFVLSSLIAAPGVAVTGASAQACGPDVPEAWTRPGGFCDQRGGSSLSIPITPGCTDYEYIFPLKAIQPRDAGGRVHVADTCIIDCSAYEASFDLPVMQKGDRARVADVPLGCQD